MISPRSTLRSCPASALAFGGFGVGVSVGVAVDVAVGTEVCVAVAVGVSVAAGAGVMVAVGVSVTVNVEISVAVATGAWVAVGDKVGSAAVLVFRATSSEPHDAPTTAKNAMKTNAEAVFNCLAILLNYKTLSIIRLQRRPGIPGA